MKTSSSYSAVTRTALIVSLLIASTLFFTCCIKEIPVIHVVNVSVSPSSLELIEGSSATLSAVVSPELAENKVVIWSSSNPSVATVNYGIVTAVSPGSATIIATAMDGGITGTCNVTVKSSVIPVTSISLNKSTLTLPEGDYENLFPTITPSNATNTGLEWESSDESVATVYKGKVTAVKVGKATITVKTNDGGKTASCEVTVIAGNVPVTGVNLSKTSLDLIETDIVSLTAKILPENASNKKVSWSSSDETVATVSAGKVTAVKAGTATITVTTEDGSKTATCSVKVAAKSSSAN